MRHQHEPLFRLRQFNHLKLDCFVEGYLRRFRAGISLNGERHLDHLARRLLDQMRQFSLNIFLFVGRRHMHRKPRPQSVHRRVYLAAILSFASVIACAWTAFATRSQHTPIEDDCTGLPLDNFAPSG